MTTIESDYQVGRRVEQVVTGAGTLRRMTVAVVVKQALSETQIEKLKEVLGLAVGFNSQRGDAIVVQTMETLARSSGMVPATVAVEGAAGVGEELRATATPDGQPAYAQGQAPAPRQDIWVLATIFGAAAILGAAYFLLGSAKRLENKRLQDIDREQVLVNVRQWIQGPAKQEEVA